jgi:hypothetical protein
MQSREAILKRRDAKALPHLEQYAPVWLVDEIVMPDDDAVQFNVVFQHHLYGWVDRRYRYDAFNDVLYQKGQTLVDDERVMEVQETDPWVVAGVADVPNAYGG